MTRTNAKNDTRPAQGIRPLRAIWRSIPRLSLILSLSAATFAQGSLAIAQSAGFGSTDAVENQLRSDREQVDDFFEIEALDPYFAFKDRLAADYGLAFGLDYTTVGQLATDSAGDDAAAGGMVRLFGSWELLNRGASNSGAVVFKIEHRHGYTDVPPSGFGFETGYVGLTASPFSDQEWRLTNLYWRQRLGDGGATVTAGFLDVTDHVDVYALGSPWTHFMNLAFSTGGGAIGLPNEASFGLTGGVYLTDNIYAIAGVTDANADPTDPFSDIFVDGELFASAEIGWVSSPDRFIFDNIHATLWHTDGSVDQSVDDGFGVAASASWYVDDQWLPFLRAGFSEGGAALYDRSVSVGLGWQPTPGAGRDVLGLGLNWSRPNGAQFGPGLGDQFAAEAFYRINLGRSLALTPDVQLIFDQALDPDTDVNAIFGVRGRLAL